MLNWFSLSLRLNRFPIKKAQNVLREIQAIPEQEYAAYVEQKKTEIVRYHLKNNAFYRQLFGAKDFSRWEDVPVMTKEDLQAPLEQRLSRGFPLKKVYVSKTSGSSGHPFIFAKDRFCHALSWAEFIDRYNWYGIDLDRSVQARFYGIPLDRLGYLRERIKDRFGFRYRFPIFNLSESKMEEFLKDFKRKDFHYINGYTSSILLFAKFLQKKNIILKDYSPHLKICIVTSEMLFQEDRKLMEQQFGVPVVNEYGASELGLLAFENEAREWIFNCETMYVEVLNEHNEILPYGEKGRMVVTSLYNKAHPFIRYDIGDTGVLHEDSNPKKMILQDLLGRTNDVAVLPSGKVVPGLTFYYVTKSIIEDDGLVKEFIVQQKAPESFTIIYVSENQLPDRKMHEVKKAMATYVEDTLELEFVHKKVLNRSKRGKLKQFESLI